MLGILNRVNEYIVTNAPDSTVELRNFVVIEIPKFLIEYQALRFPEILDPSCVSLPVKRDLSVFPEVIYETGLFIPVSACLRLIAVSLSDRSAKQTLVDNPESVRSIVSHMVDDPLNPYQRESAVFLVKVLTTDFPPAKEALAKCMAPYIKYALSEACQPDFFDASSQDAILDRSVLDPRCCWDTFLEQIEAFLTEDYVPDQKTDILLSTVKSSLSKLNRPEDYKYILSLSGGVDSMSLCVILVKLGVKFAAVHIRHSSRSDETIKELEWVQYICKKLSIQLFHHHVLVARPHGPEDSASEISRDDFEDYARQIRFGMYRKAMNLFSDSNNQQLTVLIGHHLDDVDENRVAELGKGNLINIDGMAEDNEDEGLSDTPVVVRPFCSNIRKNQIRQFAMAFKIPHMKNSTPKWSKRGWIRDVLDSCGDSQGQSFLNQLDNLGRASRDLNSVIEHIVKEWIENRGVTSGSTLHVHAKSKQFSVACGVIDLAPLESLAFKHHVWDEIAKVIVMCNQFGYEWNEKVADFRRLERSNMECPIQKIRCWKDQDLVELRALFFTKCFQKCFSSLRTVIPIERFATKKSVSQLLENLNAKVLKSYINWKVNNLLPEIPIVQIEKNRLYILRPDETHALVQGLFDGNRDAFKKTIVSNIDRIVIGCL